MRGFSPLLFRLYASDLSDAIYALSRERQMGIASLKAELAHIPGIGSLTMRAGQNGRTEIYQLGDVEVELPAGARSERVATAFASKKKLKSLS
jgi:hypothetical protein